MVEELTKTYCPLLGLSTFYPTKVTHKLKLANAIALYWGCLHVFMESVCINKKNLLPSTGAVYLQKRKNTKIQ